MTAKIKQAAIIAAIVIVAAFSIIVAWGNAEHRAYLKSKGESAALTAQYDAKAKQADLAILTLQNEAVILRAEKKRALDNAALHEQDAAAKQLEIDRLKSQTAALPPDALTGAINIRIGFDQSRVTAGGLYFVTRAGMEATLNRFLDGEGYQSQYESGKAAILNLHAAVDAAERETANSDKQRLLIQGKYDAAILAWAADKDALKHLERSLFGRRTKSFITGAALGVASVLIFQLAKGK